jgi:zinc protease
MDLSARFIGSVVLALSLHGGATSAATERVFPYPVHKKTLPNGLDLVVIETPEFKEVLSLNTLVLAGSRNETEPGKSGLAHLFEHILFRHRHGGVEGGYDDGITRLGAFNNASTWPDTTFYYPLTFTANLDRLLELESARFTALDFDEAIFKTEAGAVLGEYRRIASSPSLKLSEKQLELLFPHHPYGHTVIGYYEDVVDMPNEYRAAVEFYDTYYRPNNSVIVVSGDVKAEVTLAKVGSFYQDWKRKDVPQVPLTGSAPQREQRQHVGWNADVAPLLWVSHRMPAFRPGTGEAAVAQLLRELLVAEAAPLYKKLRYEKRWVSALYFADDSEFESFDPAALTLAAQLFPEEMSVKGRRYFDEVASEIVTGIEDLKTFSQAADASRSLATLKSKYRYDFLAALASPAAIARIFAWYYRFDRDPEVLDKMLEAVARLTPPDIDRFAATHFVPANRAILTLAREEEANP